MSQIQTSPKLLQDEEGALAIGSHTITCSLQEFDQRQQHPYQVVLMSTTAVRSEVFLCMWWLSSTLQLVVI